MAMTAQRTMPTEATIVPRAVLDFTFRVDVQKWTFLVMACIESRVEVALRHFGHVVFMQEFALIALLAQAAKPMFTHNGAIAAYVPERARCALLAFGAIRTVEELTHSGRRFWLT